MVARVRYQAARGPYKGCQRAILRLPEAILRVKEDYIKAVIGPY